MSHAWWQSASMCVTVLHHRQDAGSAGARPVLIGPVRVAMTAMKAVEVAGLVRGMDWHPGEARLLEIEYACACELIDERHAAFSPHCPRGI